MKFLSFVLLFCFSAFSFAAPFTPEQEARIKAMIRETLVSDSTILAQAVDAWQQESGQSQVKHVMDSQRKALYEDADSPRMGAEKPRLTLVAFTDYNCPYCKQFDPLLEKIIQRYPDVELIIKPLPFKGESSVNAARVALSAWRQQPQQFLALHQRLMAKKGYHDAASIRASQQKSGTAEVKVDEQSMNTLRVNLQLAEMLAIQGTPATLIGDEILVGAVSWDALEERVKQQLAKSDAG